MKKVLQSSIVLLILFSIYRCTEIDYVELHNGLDETITILINGEEFPNLDNKLKLLTKSGNFKEYEVQANSEIYVNEYYNGRIDESIIPFDTLIIKTSKKTIELYGKKEIFAEFKENKCEDFIFEVK